MKRAMIVVLILIAGIASFWGYQRYLAPSAPPALAPDDLAESADGMENVIWASGKLEPELWAGLSPATTGIISRINVVEGEWVEPGTVVLELRSEVLESQVATAEANVVEAQAALDKLLVGATPGELAAAEAQVAAAQAQIDLAAGQLTECEASVTQAQTQVQIAGARYAELSSHPTASEITAADAELAIAEAAVAHAQAAYNVVRGDPQIGSRPESLALYQATAALEAAKSKAELAKQGPTAEQLAVAQSEIDAAEAAVAMAQSHMPSSEAAVLAALAEHARAQAALDDLRAGATTEEIAIGEAHVLSAQAALQGVQAQLHQSQIIAPFAGQVGTISLRVGEMATPGQPVMLLGDPHRMHVETTDLRETDVVRLHTGMSVEVTFDAMPDRIFEGTLTDIASVSNTEKGSTNYTVHIDVAGLDEALRWGMTAFINIQVAQ